MHETMQLCANYSIRQEYFDLMSYHVHKGLG